MTIEEQVNTIERALGERMIEHALVILRQWVGELHRPDYNEHIDRLEQDYRRVFNYYLSVEDPERERILDELTEKAFRLVDDVYADLRIRRGMSPDVHTFNHENPRSVMHYFASCVHLQDSDFEWLRESVQSPEQGALGLIAVAALGQNLRECFSETALLTLIDIIGTGNMLASDQALSTTILLLAHYDVRIDFFPTLQDAFATAIGDGEHAFQTLCALIRSTKVSLRDMIAAGELQIEDLPEALREILHIDEEGDPMENMDKIESWMPTSENEYLAGIIAILPDTWVYSAIVGDDEERLQKIQMSYLAIGKMDLLWEQPELAEPWLVERLCTPQATPMDYINYGHCCFLRGDRMMAYENYREARTRCKTAKAFFALFRPDRHCLVDNGIPLEQVYLMEDLLLTGE